MLNQIISIGLERIKRNYKRNITIVFKIRWRQN